MPWYRNRIKRSDTLQADQQREAGVVYVNGKPVNYDIGDYLCSDKHGNTFLYPKILFEEGYILET